MQRALESNDHLSVVTGIKPKPNASVIVDILSEWKKVDTKARLRMSSSLDEEDIDEKVSDAALIAKIVNYLPT